MPEYVLDVDPLDGSVRYMDCDEATDTVTIYTKTDVTPLVERNKAAQNAVDHSAPAFMHKDQCFYHVASITPAEHKELIKKGIVTSGWKILDKKAFDKFLNDPEFKYLRKLTSKKI
jgi:hypothetical protein